MENQPSTALTLAIDEFSDLLPAAIKNAYLTVPPEHHLLTEKELKKICFPRIRSATDGRSYEDTTQDVDDRLRHGFWLEFENAMQQDRTMVPGNIYARIVSTTYFYEVVLKNPLRVAWITHPPGNYVVDVETLLTRTTNRLFEIVETPFKSKICRCHYICKCKPKGIPRGEWDPSQCACRQPAGCICPEKVDTKAMELILKMRDSLELRAKGSIPQVVRQTTMSMQLHGKAPESKQLTQAQSVEEMERELREIKAKQEALLIGTAPQEQATQSVIEVTTEVVE